VPRVPISKYTANKDWESLTITVQGFKNTTLDLINTYVSPRHMFDLDQATAGSENILLQETLMQILTSGDRPTPYQANIYYTN